LAQFSYGVFEFSGARKFEDAVRELRQAVQERPDWAEAWSNLGVALNGLRQANEAISACKRAIQLKEDLPQAHNNLATAYSSQGSQSEAVASLRRAIQLRPEHVSGHSNLLLGLHYLPEITAEEIFQEHKKWATVHVKEPPPASNVSRLTPKRATEKTRIGYISADFYGHVVSYFIEPILREHDHSKFAITCYADLTKADSTSERLFSLADSYRVIKGMPTETVAQAIRQDAIDILVDLGGHTSPQILKVMALKPAPIQATYLGYPDTTGLTTIDYRITDEIADPPGTEKYHTEKLLRLPRCAWCFLPQKEAHDATVAPPDPNRPITFGSFNALAKVTPWVIELWAEVLKAVPGSRLLLKAYTLAEEATKTILRQNFARFGIDPSRLILESHQKFYVDHLNLYAQVDVALDSYPYNGTTTTCEALWMGVPVVHLAGQTHVSRVGRSLLTAVGLPDLSANSREEYIQIARTLARDRDRRSELRKTLRNQMRLSPLMDAKGIALAIEAAYRAMCADPATAKSQT